ncbi:MAG: GNAT family N-acetyltransferase, partial [Myxococcota bacterium]
PKDTHALRHRVLRPHQTLADCAYPGDAVPGAFHTGVRLGERGPLVAVGSISPERDASGRAEFGDWRIRGMAVDPAHRGAGHGRRVLDALVAHARDAGGVAPWCNARERALSFYERAGFRVYGERFDVPGIGPHFVMAHRSP